jgi:hypothetical protein
VNKLANLPTLPADSQLRTIDILSSLSGSNPISNLDECRSLERVTVVSGLFTALTLDVPKSENLTDLSVINCPNLTTTTITFPRKLSDDSSSIQRQLNGVILKDNPNLASVTFTPYNLSYTYFKFKDNPTFDISNCKITDAAKVNDIITWVKTYASRNLVYTGTLKLSGGTTSAPSGVGVTNKNYLTTAPYNWSILTN